MPSFGHMSPIPIQKSYFYSFFQTSEEVFWNSKKCSDELYIEYFLLISVLQGKRKIRRGRIAQIRNLAKSRIGELAQHILRKWDLAEIRLKYIPDPGYIYIVLRWGRNTALRSNNHCYFHTQYHSQFLLLFRKLVLTRDPRGYGISKTFINEKLKIPDFLKILKLPNTSNFLNDWVFKDSRIEKKCENLNIISGFFYKLNILKTAR